MSDKVSRAVLYCSFCGKADYEVARLIAGPTVFICDECIVLCMDIIGEDQGMNAYQKVLDQSGMAIVPKSVLREHGIKWPPAKTSLEKFEDFHGKGVRC